MKVIDQTRALCPRCRIWHPAELVREGNRVVAIVHCPVEEARREVSSDADLFLAIRRKSSGAAKGCIHFNMDDNHPGSKSHEDACRRRL